MKKKTKVTPKPIKSKIDENAAPEFDPCDVCGGTEANFDGFCPQCEIPMGIKIIKQTQQPQEAAKPVEKPKPISRKISGDEWSLPPLVHLRTSGSLSLQKQTAKQQKAFEALGPKARKFYEFARATLTRDDKESGDTKNPLSYIPVVHKKIRGIYGKLDDSLKDFSRQAKRLENLVGFESLEPVRKHIAKQKAEALASSINSAKVLADVLKVWTKQIAALKELEEEAVIFEKINTDLLISKGSV